MAPTIGRMQRQKQSQSPSRMCQYFEVRHQVSTVALQMAAKLDTGVANVATAVPRPPFVSHSFLSQLNPTPE
jgi:hypothetical protein